MTYKEFSDKQKEILADAKSLLKKLDYAQWEKRMNDLIELQDKYLEQRGAK